MPPPDICTIETCRSSGSRRRIGRMSRRQRGRLIQTTMLFERGCTPAHVPRASSQEEKVSSQANACPHGKLTIEFERGDQTTPPANTEAYCLVMSPRRLPPFSPPPC